MARILIVDDSADIRLALATTLKNAGHVVLKAEDGDGILDIVVSESPEAILLDVLMPRVALATLKAADWLVASDFRHTVPSISETLSIGGNR